METDLEVSMFVWRLVFYHLNWSFSAIDWFLKKRLKQLYIYSLNHSLEFVFSHTLLTYANCDLFLGCNQRPKYHHDSFSHQVLCFTDIVRVRIFT